MASWFLPPIRCAVFAGCRRLHRAFNDFFAIDMIMNETIRNILTRRSVRCFDPQRFPTDEQIAQIVECGKYAANGMGLQHTKMLVVTDAATRDRISRMNARILGTDSDPFYGAPVIIMVLARAGWRNRVYDGSLVMGNLMLAAHSLGVDSIWIHRAKEECETSGGREILERAGINPDEWEGIGHCALGFRKGDVAEPKPRKSDFVHWLR